MKIAVVVDIDFEREDFQVNIQQVTKEGNDLISFFDDDNPSTVKIMSALCEGICTLIHCADQSGEKPSHKSLEDCINHITDGFADPQYKGVIINKKK